MSNDECRKEQHAKLRALIEPLNNALSLEPADAEDGDEEIIWQMVNDLHDALSYFFDEI